MKEVLRYLENAKELLKTVQIEDNTYTDIKPVQEACVDRGGRIALKPLDRVRAG